MKPAVFICFLVFLYSCNELSREKNKSKLVTVRKIDKYLYKEVFEIADEGAWGGEIFAAYATDSFNFRVFLGTYDFAHEALGARTNGDSLKVFLYRNNGKDSTLVKVYSRELLTQQKIFE